MKLQMLQDTLRRGLGEEWDTELPNRSKSEDIPFRQASPWRYRRRARFHISRNPDSIGFLQRAGSEMVPLRECPVLDPAFDELLCSQNAESIMQHALTGHAPNADRAVLQVPAFAGDSGAVFGDDETAVAVQDQSGTEKTFHLDPGVFFQSNTELLGRLISLAAGPFPAAHAKRNGRAADLFSGVGVFAAFLEDRFAEITAVERDARCLAYARRNLGGGTRFVTSSVEKWSKRGNAGDGSDSMMHLQRLVADPPRTGISKAVLQRIISWEPEEVAYVSCNPVTFARDAARLQANGYVLRLCEGFDLYPQTSHIEVFGLFTR